VPEVPPEALRIFESYCADIPPHDLEALRTRVRSHVREIQEAARRNEMLPVDLAEALGHGLDGLLREAPGMPVPVRRLIVGAARYFVSAEDHIPDTGGILGLDDDIAVFNHVADRIGRRELSIAP
jgi:uncharacterized membrane protein YkvA (DUF1232 family)